MLCRSARAGAGVNCEPAAITVTATTGIHLR
jgi:hypothetical protein